MGLYGVPVGPYGSQWPTVGLSGIPMGPYRFFRGAIGLAEARATQNAERREWQRRNHLKMAAKGEPEVARLKRIPLPDFRPYFRRSSDVTSCRRAAPTDVRAEPVGSSRCSCAARGPEATLEGNVGLKTTAIKKNPLWESVLFLIKAGNLYGTGKMAAS